MGCVKFSEEDKTLPLIGKMGSSNDTTKSYSVDLDLCNPYSKATCLILYLYSMDSYIQSELNKACWNMDVSKITNFGPFASALGYITSGTEMNK